MKNKINDMIRQVEIAIFQKFFYYKSLFIMTLFIYYLKDIELFRDKFFFFENNDRFYFKFHKILHLIKIR